MLEGIEGRKKAPEEQLHTRDGEKMGSLGRDQERAATRMSSF